MEKNSLGGYCDNDYPGRSAILLEVIDVGYCGDISDGLIQVGFIHVTFMVTLAASSVSGSRIMMG